MEKLALLEHKKFIQKEVQALREMGDEEFRAAVADRRDRYEGGRDQSDTHIANTSWLLAKVPVYRLNE